MNPYEILRREYGDSRNLMTPRRLGVGRLPNGAYEVSRGTGIEHEPIWGVSVVRLRADGTTWRDTNASKLFHNKALAWSYVKQLKQQPVVQEEATSNLT